MIWFNILESFWLYLKYQTELQFTITFSEFLFIQQSRYKNGSGVFQNQEKSLDIPNGTQDEGAHLLAFHINHGATNQQWDIFPNQ